MDSRWENGKRGGRLWRIVAVVSIALHGAGCTGHGAAKSKSPDGGAADTTTNTSPDGAPSSKPAKAPACNHDASAARAAQSSLCEQNGWCWENPLPFGRTVSPASAVGANDLWILSQNGLLHRSGTDWVSIGTPLDTVFGAFVHSPDDIWVSGAHQGSALTHYDGSTWTDFSSSVYGYESIAGSTSGATWALANDGSQSFCTRFDGTSWTKVPGFSETFAGPDDILALFVLDDDDVWVATMQELHHYASGTWTTVSVPASSALHEIWASGSADVWFGGQGTDVIPDIGHNVDIVETERPKGLLLHWNGKGLSPVNLPDITTIGGIGGTAPGDVWIGSTDGELVHYDGTNARLDTSFTASRAIAGFAAAAPNDVLALLAGDLGGVVHWDGTRWSDASPFPTIQKLTAVWGSASNDVWAVGSGGFKLHFDGTKWSAVPGDAESYTAIWGTATDNIWATAQSGAIEHYDGAQWSIAYQHDEEIDNLWGTGPSSLWVSGGGFVGHFDGSSFDRMDVSTGSEFSQKGLWAAADDDVWALTGEGAAHFDGTSWTKMLFPNATADATALWGRTSTDVWAAGLDGLYHYDGTSWGNALDLTSTLALNLAFPSQIGGCDDRLWIADIGQVLTFDGTSWTTSVSGIFSSNGIFGLSPDSLVTVGPRGGILRRASE